MNILNKLATLEVDAADFGFKWETPQQIKQQIVSELDEIEVHLQDHDRHKLQEELGDLLHAVFSLTVFCKFDPEETLTKSVDKFARRLEQVKKITRSRGMENLNGQSFS